MIEIEVNPVPPEAVTLSVAVPMTAAPLEDLPVAVIVAVPAPMAIAMPLEDTVAMPGTLEDQVTCVVRS